MTGYEPSTAGRSSSAIYVFLYHSLVSQLFFPSNYQFATLSQSALYRRNFQTTVFHFTTSCDSYLSVGSELWLFFKIRISRGWLFTHNFSHAFLRLLLYLRKYCSRGSIPTGNLLVFHSYSGSFESLRPSSLWAFKTKSRPTNSLASKPLSQSRLQVLHNLQFISFIKGIFGSLWKSLLLRNGVYSSSYAFSSLHPRGWCSLSINLSLLSLPTFNPSFVPGNFFYLYHLLVHLCFSQYSSSSSICLRCSLLQVGLFIKFFLQVYSVSTIHLPLVSSSTFFHNGFLLSTSLQLLLYYGCSYHWYCV